MVFIWSTATRDETFSAGRMLGQLLSPGDFVGLVGELGAGKTVFSRGVAAGAGVSVDDVSSPTYAIVQTYTGRLALHHADFYRLHDESDLFGTGFFDLTPEGAFLVEWLNRVPSAAPVDHLNVDLEVIDERQRRLTISSSGPKSDVLLTRWQQRLPLASMPNIEG